ncbi:MAG: sigma-70 family RNA polymerase sigma factor [Planctomycetes bacterium]|jgi:RNA polymerase sigma-70 factor (ECF subfamily)|nr:sigma-70 family RNA polymerase sigma factor [Planctomycetota bacterium]
MSDIDTNVDLFVRLLARYQGQIYAYILSIVGNYNDSDDIFQETSSKLWEMFGQYEPGTDFLKWALSVAYYRVLDYRKNAKRHQKVLYSDDFFKQLADSAPQHLSKTREYLERLAHCIDKLRPQDATLIKMRYNDAIPVSDIAARINRTMRCVYFNLARIQRLLLKCIEDA